tara:strand:- start:25858 stop:26058 length:201 start_codon:yes stop_codon:yes gene_type:complete
MEKTVIIKHQFLGDYVKLFLETQTIEDKITVNVIHSQTLIKKSDKKKIEQFRIQDLCDKNWKKSKK